MTLNHIGQLRGQLIQVGDVQKGIPVNPLDIFLIATNGSRNKQDAFPLVFLLGGLRSLDDIHAHCAYKKCIPEYWPCAAASAHP